MFSVVPQLTVSDMSRSVKFYRKRLGFEVTHKDPEEKPEFVALEREGVSLFLVSQGSREEPYQIEDLQKNKRGVGIRIYFEVDDARADYESLKAASVKIVRELQYNEEEDYTEFSFLDPDGYEIGIYS
jgi:catechol 2,3-dioxygenase-like lactoylglutathione lyase family enzyme